MLCESPWRQEAPATMTRINAYEAAAATLDDMYRPLPWDVYAGERVILGNALQAPKAYRAGRIRERIGLLLQTTFYAHGAQWAESAEYRRILIESLDALCEEINNYDAAMRHLADEQRDKLKGL